MTGYNITTHPSLPGWYKVSFAYNPELVAALKKVVPVGHRSWDAATKTWSVSGTYINYLRDAFQREGAHTTTSYEQPRRTGTSTNWSKPDRIEVALTDLFKAVPEQLTAPLYKAMACVMHPDKGGTDQLMTALNKARQTTGSAA